MILTEPHFVVSVPVIPRLCEECTPLQSHIVHKAEFVYIFDVSPCDYWHRLKYQSDYLR